MEGISEFPGEEFEWAVGTVMVNVYDPSALNNDGLRPLAEDLVGVVWKFIHEMFLEMELAPPDRERLVSAVVERLQQEKADRLKHPEDYD